MKLAIASMVVILVFLMFRLGFMQESGNYDPGLFSYFKKYTNASCIKADSFQHHKAGTKLMCSSICFQMKKSCSGFCYSRTKGVCRTFDLRLEAAPGNVLFEEEDCKLYLNDFGAMLYDTKPVFYFLEYNLTMSSANAICTKDQGALAVPQDGAEMAMLANLTSTIWVGLTDEESQNSFYVHRTGLPPPYTAWKKGEPQRNDSVNCAIIANGSMVTESCYEKHYSVCEYDWWLNVNEMNQPATLDPTTTMALGNY